MPGTTPMLSLVAEMSPPAYILEMEFAALGVDVRSFKDPLERTVRQVIIPSIGQNFDVGGRPPWPALDSGTLDYHPTGQTLVRTGNLQRAAQQLNNWKYTREEAFVDHLPARTFYGPFHQFGSQAGKGSTLPPRPFMMVQIEDEAQMEQVFEQWLTERLMRHGFSRGIGF